MVYWVLSLNPFLQIHQSDLGTDLHDMIYTYIPTFSYDYEGASPWQLEYTRMCVLRDEYVSSSHEMAMWHAP